MYYLIRKKKNITAIPIPENEEEKNANESQGGSWKPFWIIITILGFIGIILLTVPTIVNIIYLKKDGVVEKDGVTINLGSLILSLFIINIIGALLKVKRLCENYEKLMLLKKGGGLIPKNVKVTSIEPYSVTTMKALTTKGKVDNGDDFWGHYIQAIDGDRIYCSVAFTGGKVNSIKKQIEINGHEISVGDTVYVYIDPKDPNNYWMDIDFLLKK